MIALHFYTFTSSSHLTKK